MSIIEQHVELTDDTLTVPIPAEWKGKGATLNLTLDEEEVATVPIMIPKIDLTRFGGKWAHIPLDQRLKMQQELDDMRNEWERDI